MCLRLALHSSSRTIPIGPNTTLEAPRSRSTFSQSQRSIKSGSTSSSPNHSTRANRLSHSHESPAGAARSSFASSIMRISYGIEVADENDEYATAVEVGVATFNRAFVPGAFLVETFPSMRYIPSWFPGAGWKKKAEYWRYINDLVASGPWDTVKEQMVRRFLLWSTVPKGKLEKRNSGSLYRCELDCRIGK